jgi:hypothetical protein
LQEAIYRLRLLLVKLVQANNGCILNKSYYLFPLLDSSLDKSISTKHKEYTKKNWSHYKIERRHADTHKDGGKEEAADMTKP